jgi:hypothetical protein
MTTNNITEHACPNCEFAFNIMIGSTISAFITGAATIGFAIFWKLNGISAACAIVTPIAGIISVTSIVATVSSALYFATCSDQEPEDGPEPRS